MNARPRHHKMLGRYESPASAATLHAMTARRSMLGLLAVVGVSWALGGCAKPLLSPDEPRTQFDRYDAVRSQYATQYVYDEYGKRKPNLRARLLPKE